jgi:hypothetical protein
MEQDNSGSVKESPSFYETRSSIAVFTIASHCEMKPVDNLRVYFLNIGFNAIHHLSN